MMRGKPPGQMAEDLPASAILPSLEGDQALDVPPTGRADQLLGVVERRKRIEEVDGIGCRPVVVSATTDEMLDWIGEGLR